MAISPSISASSRALSMVRTFRLKILRLRVRALPILFSRTSSRRCSCASARVCAIPCSSKTGSWALRDGGTRGNGDGKKGVKKASGNQEFLTSDLRVSASPRFRVSRRMLAAGVVAGLLPLIHAHSFITVMGVGACLALINWRQWREWLTFLLVASIIAGPQLLWSMHGSAVSTRSFIGWEFGWGHGNENFFWFWLKNTGLFIPLLLIALLWKREDYLVSRKLMLFYLPFTLCFIIPNVLKLAPWIWDNIKVLYYWWIASAPIVALLLARLWESNAWKRALAAILFVVLTLAGGLDVFALLTQQGEYQEFDRDGVNLAEIIKQKTPPRSTVLHAPIHNTPVFLTGRRSIMGYPGHIWTHGIDFGPRESDVKKIYSGSLDAADLLSKYGVDYVVIDPQEHSVMPVNDAFFSHYPEVATIGAYHLYKIKP